MITSSPDPRSILKRFGFAPDHAAAIAAIFKAVFGDRVPAAPRADDSVYANNLRKLAERHGPTGDNGAIQHIGRQEDVIARHLGAFTFVKALNWAAMACLPSVTSSPVLLATVRNEGPFLVEWIAHHRAIGFDKIVLYTHDNADGSDDLLRALANHGIIRLVTGEAGGDINPQIKAYEHALMFDSDLRRHSWWMTLDADEFLIIDQRYDFSLSKFIAAVEAVPAAPDCICFNWLWMGSGGAIARTSLGVTERFVDGAPTVPYVKSLFRPAKVLSLHSVHKPVLVAGATIVNSAMAPVSLANHDIPFEFAGGRINHYWNKSFEEFLVKQARGKDRGIWRRGTELFFDWDIPEALVQGGAPPPSLLARGRAARETLLKIPAVLAAHRATEDLYEVLSRDLHPGYSLEEAFDAAKARTRILRSLRRAPSTAPTGELVKALKMSIRRPLASFTPPVDRLT